MKKFLLLALVCLFAGTQYSNARIVLSRTYGEKAKPKTEWIIRTGLSLNNAAGSALGDIQDDWDDVDCSYGTRAGFDLSVAFNRPMGKSGLYWGMELGLGTRGAKMSTKCIDRDYYEDSKKQLLTWNAKFSPFTLGYKFSLTEKIRLDAHLGAFVSYDFAGSGSVKWEESDVDYTDKGSFGDDFFRDFQKFDAGIQFGVGIWYDRFNFDITYQRGFVNAYDFKYEFGSHANDWSVFSSNVMLRVGVAF